MRLSIEGTLRARMPVSNTAVLGLLLIEYILPDIVVAPTSFRGGLVLTYRGTSLARKKKNRWTLQYPYVQGPTVILGGGCLL